METNSQERELTAKEVSERLDVPLRTIIRWFASRPDLFPSARKTRPYPKAPYVVKESDVIRYEELYPKPNLKE